MSDPDLTFLLRRSLQLANEGETPVCPSCLKRVRHRQGVDWCRDMEMSERTLQNRIIARARKRGWTVAHAGKAWVGDVEAGEGQMITPMLPGWPDLFLLNPKCKAYQAFAIECKAQRGELRDDQKVVLALLNACGIPAVVVKPSDLREGRVNALLEGR